MWGKHSLFLLYMLITVVLFATFDARWDVWLSFFISAGILTFITIFHIYAERDYSPFISSFIVFTFLFFLVAPMVQINSFEGVKPLFETKYPYRADEVLFTNFLVCLFNIIFFASYIFLKRYKPLRQIPTFSKDSERALPLTLITVGVVCVLIFVLSLEFVLDEVRRPSWKGSIFPTIVILFWKKVFFLVPFGGILLCMQYFKKENKKLTNLLIIGGVFLFFFILLFWFKNPLVEKRNALGPIYICLIFLFLPRLLNSNVKTLFFLFFSMIILFPLTAIVTHSDATFEELLEDPGILLEQMKGGGIANAFNTLNYDAFSNIMTTIEYTGQQGFAMGNQFLSAFLFFVPRAIWEDKPTTTGQLVGEYLIDDYGFTYSNLSNPLVSEGYINFGIIGVVLVAVALAFVIVKLLSWLKSDHMLKKIMAFYFAIHLIFLLRGDFANGFSYYLGTLAGVIIIPKLIELFLRHFFKTQQQWKASKA